MPPTNEKLRVAMPAWEIGRVATGLGVKIGGLGVVVEELPPELIKAADRRGLDLEIETLTPCFAHYDRGQLTRVDLRLPATLDGHTFEFEVYERIFPDGQKVIYFWDEGQLGELDKDRETFAEFFVPGRLEYSDRFDLELKQALE